MKCPAYIAIGIKTAIVFLGLVGGSRSAFAQRPLGCDVSSYQGSSVNWSSLHSEGISFAWAKATEGTDVIDATYAGNITHGKSAGVFMGSYHFAHPESDAAAVQANYFWAIAGGNIKGDGLTLMPMLDMEVFDGIVGTTTYASWVNLWCQSLTNSAAAVNVAIKPVIYISACHADELNSTVSQWYNDIADYNGQSAQTSTPWTVCADDDVWGSSSWNFWQYDDTASYAGFPAEQPDVDVFHGTAAGLTSYLATVINPLNTVYSVWDPQGTTGSNPYTSSMTGTWENNNWSSNYIGQVTPTNWTDGKSALFGVHTGVGTPAFTITMNNNHILTGIADGITNENACNVTISGAGIIEMSGQPVFNLSNGADGSLASVTINNRISGFAQIVPEGNGQLYLNGTNLYSAGTMLGSSTNAWTGTINFNNNSSFGTAAITMTTFGTGSTLSTEGSSPITISNAVAMAAGTLNIIPGVGGTTFSGPWSLGTNTPTIGTGSTSRSVLTISGPISGTGGITKSNNGSMVLTGTNTYTGSTTIVTGALTVGDPGVLNNGIYAGAIVDNGSFTYSSSASQTLSGSISGTGSLAQNGPGTLTLSGVNSYTGSTTLNGGIFSLKSGGALGISGTIIFHGGTLQYSSANHSDYSSRFNAGTPFNIDVNGQSVTFGSVLGNTNGGSLTLDDSAGGGILQLSAANTYIGPTTINAGTLALSTGGSINNSSMISIAPGATFDVSAISTFILSSNTTLNASGASMPATINGAGNINVGAQPIILAYDGSHPALNISQGTLILNGNVFTINGASLPVGNYVIVQQANGSITSSGSYTVSGTAVGAAGSTAAISINAGNVILSIAGPSNNLPVTINRPLLSNGALQLSVTGTPGYTYFIQATTNLNPPVAWTNLSTNLADSNGAFNFIDWNVTNFGIRYYRTTVAPQ